MLAHGNSWFTSMMRRTEIMLIVRMWSMWSMCTMISRNPGFTQRKTTFGGPLD